MEQIKTQAKKVMDYLPQSFKDTALVRLFGITKVPLLAFLSPSVLQLDDQVCRVKIPLTWRSKNHLNCMYFAALAAGADCAAGLSAMKLINQAPKKGSLIFKDFKATFLKRAEGDTVFVCDCGEDIQQLIEKCLETNERHHILVPVTAFVPSKLGDEPVAEFELTLSVKFKP